MSHLTQILGGSNLSQIWVKFGSNLGQIWVKFGGGGQIWVKFELKNLGQIWPLILTGLNLTPNFDQVKFDP